LHILKDSTTVDLGYPSLIHALCREGKIVISSAEKIVHPKLVISKKIIQHLTRKQLYTSAPPQDAEAQPSRSHRPLPVTKLNEDIINRIEAMQLQLTQRQDELELRHKQRHDGIQHQLNQLHISMNDHYQQLQNSMHP